MHGYWGAVLVMTLGSYPLVYLPVAASLQNRRPGPRGRRARARARAHADVLPRHAPPDPPGARRRHAPRRADPAGRVRHLRDPPLPAPSRRRSTPSSSSASALDDRAAPSRSRSSCSGSCCSSRRGGRARAGGRRPARARRRGPRRGCRWGAGQLPVRARARRACSARRSALPALRARATGSTRGRRRRCRRSRCSSAAFSTAKPTAPPPRRSQRSRRVPVALLVERHRSRATIALERSTYIVQATPGHRGRAVVRLLHDPLPVPSLYLSSTRADRRLRDDVLPARARRRARRRRADPARARGGRALARARSRVGVLPRHAADPRARARGRLLARLHQRLDRADGDADPPPDRRATRSRPGSGPSPERLLLRRRRAVRSRAAPRRDAARALLLGRWFERIAGADRHEHGALASRSRSRTAEVVRRRGRCSTASRWRSRRAR